MANTFKCPVCGERNQPDQEFCQYCRSRLQPLTGHLKGADAPIKPGQMPTKRNTAELEPILPQWLREARDSARKSTDNDLPQGDNSKQKEAAPAPTFDLLAGLHSQKEDDNVEEDEVPDWLASITGDLPKSKKGQSESPEVRWVELGGAKDFAREEAPAIEAVEPSWLTSQSPAGSATGENNDLNDWFKSSSTGQAPQQPEPLSVPGNSFSPPPAASPSEATPDWLRQMVADAEAQQSDEIAPAIEEYTPPADSDSPDWLRNLSAASEAQTNNLKLDNNVVNAPAASSEEEPDWLRAMGGLPTQTHSADPLNSSEIGQGMFEAAEDRSVEKLPDWMQSPPPVADERSKQGTIPQWLQEESSPTPAGADVPSWLSGMPAMEPLSSGMEQLPQVESATFGDIPDWLKAAAPQSSIFIDQTEEKAPAASSNLADWFKNADAPQPQSVPAFSGDETASLAPPAFVETPSNESIDSLFTDMPEWLSNARENASAPNPAPFMNSDAIAPGELPSWIEAMRPINTGSSSGTTGDQRLESRGALAGLQGVLPAVPGYAASSKPKAYSIKLQASDEQQGHAALLEHILNAEAELVPISSVPSLRTSRRLRWVIAFIFVLVLTPVIFLGTQGYQFFAMPVRAPRETNSAVLTAQSIPEGAPVLAAFDYEPARAAEMEAAAAPLFGMLRNPKLTFISTNEIGGILVERFISGALAGSSNTGGVQYLNLGYLPGGQMGIRAFAQNPPETAPLDVFLNSVWTSPQLQGIDSLSKFAVLIIVTDNASSARSWIEQTSLITRGAVPVLVISSAQAVPMIQPYYESGQIDGLVAGLYGGAVVENNSGTARRYWDAYSVGMLTAMVLILVGGLASFVLGLRDRSTAREAK